MGKRFTCKYCGNTTYRKNNGHEYKYCSQSCYRNARFGKVIEDRIVSARNPQCLEAVKLCQSGLSKSEAARSVGIKPHIVMDWFHRHGDKNETVIFAGRICEHCGKSLLGMKNLSSRKYCTKSCASKAKYARDHPTRKRAKNDLELRARALELYWGGLGQMAIARHLDIPHGTVYSWVHDYGSQRERTENAEVLLHKPPKQRMSEASGADEWLRGLCDLAASNPADSEASPVHLICGVGHGKSSMNQLVTIITDCLGENPLSGETFAFCDNKHTTITTITWTEPTFSIVKHPKLYGRYIWPRKDLGPIITTTQHEFAYLISLCKRTCESRKTIDFMRFFCYN